MLLKSLSLFYSCFIERSPDGATRSGATGIIRTFFTSLVFLHLILHPGPLLHAKPVAIDIHNQREGKGDIVQLWEIIENSANGVDGKDTMRNAIKPNSPNRWNLKKDSKGYFIIPYTISGQFSKSEKATLDRAMHSIAKHTCVKFQRRGRERDYVDLQNRRNEGCYTMVGRMRGKNVVNLESNEMATCMQYPTVVHELLHVVGLWHEHMRHDRDKFIKIHYENIAQSLRPQFERISPSISATYGVSYDYRSVMHYKKDAFSRNGKVTMQTKQAKFQNVIGTAKEASHGDWRKVCAIYRCSTCMGRAMPERRKDYQQNNDEKSEIWNWLTTSLFNELPHMDDPMTMVSSRSAITSSSAEKFNSGVVASDEDTTLGINNDLSCESNTVIESNSAEIFSTDELSSEEFKPEESISAALQGDEQESESTNEAARYISQMGSSDGDDFETMENELSLRPRTLEHLVSPERRGSSYGFPFSASQERL